MPNDGLMNWQVRNLGIKGYAASLDVQSEVHAQVASGESGSTLILVEHPPVLTLGKHANQAHLRFSASHFAAEGVEVLHTDRGGEVTAHMPGQLVAYLIVRLPDFGLTARSFVALLEGAVIDTLAAFGVLGAGDPQYPGVWVGSTKICALGVRIKQRTSMHGLALNVENSLDLFRQIVPCGLIDRGVTSLSTLLPHAVTTKQVAPILAAALKQRLFTKVRLPVSAAACNGGTESLQFKL